MLTAIAILTATLMVLILITIIGLSNKKANMKIWEFQTFLENTVHRAASFFRDWFTTPRPS